MIRNPNIRLLAESEHTAGCNAADEIVPFDLNILGRTLHLSIAFTPGPASLPDIAPLARQFSTHLALTALDSLRKRRYSIPCLKGCAACCRYLVPLSAPEVFRLNDEILEMPPERRKTVVQKLLHNAKQILEKAAETADVVDFSMQSSTSHITQISGWYADLELTCPFLSQNLCTIYDQRPTACREHIITGPEAVCRPLQADGSRVVPMSLSILEALARLTAELEKSEVEAVILPLALPWAQANLDRARRTWPARQIVESFIEILKQMSPKNHPTPLPLQIANYQ